MIAARNVEIRVRGKDLGQNTTYKFDAGRQVGIKKKTTAHVTFVETDKPVYKPGDLVRVRLLTVDADLKPAVDVVKMIWIENSAGVRMEQWTNVSVDVGFAAVEMKLSKEPVKGTWQVKTNIKGKKVRINS